MTLPTRLSRRRAVQVGAAAGLAAGFAARPASRRARAQERTITFWNPNTYAVQDPNDKTRAPEDFYIYQAIERFRAAAGVTVELENIPTGPNMFVQYRTASVARNGPDMMVMWSGSYMLSLMDFLEPLGEAFSADERARITGWETVTPDFTADSPNIYGVPASTDGGCGIYYNKELLAAAGVDVEAGWPKNHPEFLAMLEQVAASGPTPLTLDTTSMVWQSLAYWMSQQIDGAKGVAELVQGERNFSDPELVATVEGWAKMAPYTVPGAEAMDGSQANQFFYLGEAAMTTAGSWLIGDATTALGDNLGMVKFPDFVESAPITNGAIGGSGNAFIVSNYSEQKDAAIEFIKFLMSREEQTLKAESGEGALVNVTDVDVSETYDSPLMAVQQEWANEPTTIFWNDNVYPAELTNEILAQSHLVWTGQMPAAEMMALVDAKRDELLGA